MERYNTRETIRESSPAINLVFSRVSREFINYITANISLKNHQITIGNYGKSLSEISGSLKPAILDSILIYNMQPFIRAFAHEAPNVQLIINSIQSGEINQSVVDGTADIGINCEKESYPDSVIHKQLGNYKAVLVASPFADRSLLDFITPHQRKPFSLICNLKSRPDYTLV